jgi:hypothetical protein
MVMVATYKLASGGSATMNPRMEETLSPNTEEQPLFETLNIEELASGPFFTEMDPHTL